MLCWLALSLFGLLPACRHTPSYNDIKLEKDGSLANANASRSDSGSANGESNPQGATPASPLEAAPNAPLVPVPDSSPAPGASAAAGPTPAYFDPKTGQIKNLPLYPGAKVRRVQYGPINGTPQVSLAALSTAPFEKVTAFYDKVVKDNGWTVDDSGRGENSYSWQLSRGQTDRAAIRVDKEPMGRISISLARTN
jgi:hypothetical protein